MISGFRISCCAKVPISCVVFIIADISHAFACYLPFFAHARATFEGSCPNTLNRTPWFIKLVVTVVGRILMACPKNATVYKVRGCVVPSGHKGRCW
jgi:hypothetical protein